MQGEAAEPLRAWVEYYRDLGIYDFYRRGEPALAATFKEEAVAAIEAEATPELASITVVASADDDRSEEPYPEAAIPSHNLSVVSSMAANKLISFNDLTALPATRVPVADRAAALLAIQQEIGDCTRCPLAYAGRRKIVFGDGSPSARLMFVGEGPGADEDAQGIPFVGKAGQLLNNMIVAMGLARADVYIANIVKCRPPNNRVPEPIEANTCSQFLLRQIDVVQPEVIVALGATAALYLLGVKQSLSALRGRWHSCRGAKLAVTYHPAFLLRDPRQKAEAWKDLQMVMGELGLTPPARK
jgi:uracil-DNA glycosylase family 4